MTARRLAPLLLILLAAASPQSRGQRPLQVLTQDAGSQGMPTYVTPAAPQMALRGAGRFEDAPMPNRDVAGPRVQTSSNQPEISPSLFTTRNQFRGDGFSPHSTAQTDQEKNFRPAPGFNLRIPLQD